MSFAYATRYVRRSSLGSVVLRIDPKTVEGFRINNRQHQSNLWIVRVRGLPVSCRVSSCSLCTDTSATDSSTETSKNS